ncbi:MAG TPA: glycosyltransferase family 39 protein [Actinomycetota bacterium]|nr:glycosyltransferase family 39 protein [Actinomycetota bacterium]
MRVDEAATYLYYVRKPPLYGLVSYTLPNNHVFHTLLVSGSTLLLGDHPWVIRLPAFVAGIALIPLTFIVARRAHGDGVGLIAAAFVATSSVLIEYSTNARGYTIVAAIFLGLLALQPALIRDEARAWRWFAILSAIGFFTIPTMLFPFGIVVASLALQRVPWKRLARGVGLTVAITAAAYLPALLWTGPHAFFGNRFVMSRPWKAWVSLVGPASITPAWAGWNRDLGVAGMLLLAVFFVVGVARDRTRLAPIAVVWCALLVVAARWIVLPRVWTFLIPVYWITVAVGIAFVARGRWASAIALAACLAIGGSVLASSSVLKACDGCFPAADRVVATLKGTQGNVLAFNPATVPLQYYAVLRGERLSIDPRRSTAGQVFIVVDTTAGQTLTTVARADAVPPDVVACATVFERFPGAIVYSAVR